MASIELKVAELIGYMSRLTELEMSKAGVDLKRISLTNISSFANIKNLDLNKLLDETYERLCKASEEVTETEANHEEKDLQPQSVKIKLMAGLLDYFDNQAGFSGMSGKFKKSIIDSYLRRYSEKFPEILTENTDLLFSHNDRRSHYYKKPTERAAKALQILVAASPKANLANTPPTPLYSTLRIDVVAILQSEQAKFKSNLPHKIITRAEPLSAGYSPFDNDTYYTAPTPSAYAPPTPMECLSPLTTTSEVTPSRKNAQGKSALRPFSSAENVQAPPRKRGIKHAATIASQAMRYNFSRRRSSMEEATSHTPLYSQSVPRIIVPRSELSSELNVNYRSVLINLKEIITNYKDQLIHFEMHEHELYQKLMLMADSIDKIPNVITENTIESAKTLTNAVQQLAQLGMEINLTILAKQRQDMQDLQQQKKQLQDTIQSQKSYSERFIDILKKIIASLSKLVSSIKDYLGFNVSSEDSAEPEVEKNKVFLPTAGAGAERPVESKNPELYSTWKQIRLSPFN